MHTLIKHQGQRPVGQSGIKFGNGASAQKFPVPFWKVCAAFDLLALGHGYGLRVIYSLGNNEQIGNADEEEVIFIAK